MSRTLVEDLAKAQRYCCIYNMLENNKEISTARLADHLGVSRTTVLHHRRRLASGELTKCYNCPSIKVRAAGLRPVTLRKSARGGTASGR